MTSPYARPATLQRLDSSPIINKATGKTVTGGRGHARGRSASSSSHGSVSMLKPASGSMIPALTSTPEGLLDVNASDVLWRVFVAFEQDCRDANNILPLLCNIEATVQSAIDPLFLAGNALEECARHVDNEFRDTIEQTLSILASGSPQLPHSEIPKPAASPTAHAKQLSLSSSRISSVCSTFRATQTSLRYYGGARKTAYQLDLFVHKYALPTSTALHKKGQEFNAVSKWIKKALPSEIRALDALDIAALRRASASLSQWTECMRTHAAALKRTGTEVKALMIERASLQAYSFPPRPIQVPPPIIAPTPVNPIDSISPLLAFTNVNFLDSSSSIGSSSAAGSAGTFDFFSPSLTGTTANTGTFPQSCAAAFATSPIVPENNMFQWLNPLDYTPSTPLDMGAPSDLFFDNLCM